MTKTMTCAEARPLLFALLEGEVDEAERTALTVHVAGCRDCRGELTRERSLTQTLRTEVAAPRAVHGPALGWRLAAAALVGIAVTAFAFTLGDRRAFGSIAPARFEPTLKLANGERRALASHNHLDVPANENDVIEMLDTGRLTVVGPAVLELDRAADAWKLVLMRGQVQAVIDEGATLLVSSVRGTWTLAAGTHLVTLQPPSAPGDALAQESSAAELLQKGYHEFFQLVDMAAAEESFAAARERPKATEEEKGKALFYLAAAIGRQDRFEEAIDLQTEWMDSHPDDPSIHYTLLFQGIYHQKLGHEEEARKAWQKIVDSEPDSELATIARSYLGAPVDPAAATTAGDPRKQAQADRYAGDRLLPDGADQKGAKVVVAWELDAQDAETRRFQKVATEAAEFQKATLIDCADGNLDRLAKKLRELKPESVLFVLRPEELDNRLHRQVLLLSTSLDEDVFPDFTFGWLTARDGKGIEELWARTRETQRKGLSSKRWQSTFVTTGMKSCEYPGYGLELAPVAGFKQSALAFATVECDPANLEFVNKHLEELDDAGVITMTGNGDPQGIWLFDDARNADPARQWKYDPKKVGQDPKGEMPRVLGAQFAALKLDRPVVWSGTCHSASTHRVFVESDIVSTFGKSDTVELYEMPLAESLGLSILAGGAVALLAPIGANHGYAVDLEGEYALVNGASLGETIKSTWDDVFLQSRGALKLVLPEAGKPPAWHVEPIMQGGGANRALLGDPTLRPFEKTTHPRERAKLANVRERSFDVVVEWDHGEHISSWNLYSAAMSVDRRLRARVVIDDAIPAKQSARLSAKLRVTDRGGKELPGFVLTHAEPEAWHGHRILHLQATAPEKTLQSEDVKATFAITWKP